MKVKIRSVEFDNVTLNEAQEMIRVMLHNSKADMVVTPNSEIVQLCNEDEKIKNIISKASLTVPDGIGVILASKILSRPLKQKVAGVELGKKVCEVLSETGDGLYILGGKPESVSGAAKNLKKEFQKLKIAGFHDGYFKNDDDIISDIKEKNPAVIFVCLGAPKQEIWMSEHLKDFDNIIMLGLGGSVDVYAGIAKRAPKIFIKLGLEWFYRLLCEPWRIGRMMKLPKFLFGTIFYKIRKGKNA